MKKNNVFAAITIGIISLFSANVYTACLDSRASLTDVARDPYEYANRVKKALSNKDYKALDILLDPDNMKVQGPIRESGKRVLQTQLQIDPKFTLNGALFEAIHRGDLNLVKYVVNKGAGVDYEHSMFTSTPIEYAKKLAEENGGSFIAIYNYLKNEKN